MESVYRLSPGRSAPYRSGEGLPTTKKMVRVFKSTAGVIQTPPPSVASNFRPLASWVFAPGQVLGRPHALGASIGNGVEGPEQLPGLRVVRLDEPADSILAAVGADQDLPVDDGWSHRLAVALVRVGDVRGPDRLSGLAVERDQFCIERPEEELVPGDRDTAVVGTAAESGRGTHRVLVVPELLAGGGIGGVHVIVRSGQEHDPVHHDGRRLHRLDHRGLEHEDRAELRDVAGIDLSGLGVAGLRVVLVGVDPIVLVVRRGVEHLLRH